MRHVAAIFALALTVIAGNFLCGCSNAVRTEGRWTLHAAVDVSDGNPKRLLVYADALYRLQRNLEPIDTIRITEFAHSTETIYDGRPIRGRSQFNAKVASKFASRRGTMHTAGTRTNLALQDLVRDCQHSGGMHSVVIMTDGGMEDLGPVVQQSINGSVKSAMAQPELTFILVAGVHQEWRKRWEDWLRPLGTRGQVRGLNDIDLTEIRGFWARR